MLALLMLNRLGINRLSRLKTAKAELKVPQGEHCRTCLNNKGLIDIFLNDEICEKRVKNLHTVTGVEIQINDGFSQKMCKECINILNTVLEFRCMCKKADKLLRKCAKVKIKTKTVKKHRETYVSPTKGDHKVPLKEETDYYDYSNDFQNEDYSYNDEDVKPAVEQYQSKPVGRRKKQSIPNAASYKCGTCSKEFKMKATYKAHLRIHTNHCICEACGKICRNNNQLQEHKRARHGLCKIHKCSYCEYSSATKEALIIHERRHTGERPYICDHCGASFHRRSNLVQHIAIHLPEKNFQCDLCPKRLKSRKFLQIHKHNSHTGRRYSYLCAVCEHRFEKPNKVRAHMRRVHHVPDEHGATIVRVVL